MVSGDIEEASRCLAELSVPHFHHELVKRALLAAFGDSAHAAALLQLLAALSNSGQVNQVSVNLHAVTPPIATHCFMNNVFICNLQAQFIEVDAVFNVYADSNEEGLCSCGDRDV